MDEEYEATDLQDLLLSPAAEAEVQRVIDMLANGIFDGLLPDDTDSATDVECDDVLEIQPVEPVGPIVKVNDFTLDKDYERLVRMSQVFGKFASTLLARRISVKLDNEPASAPAWSDSESVTFNRRKIRKLDDPAVVTSLRGLMLHEISHILMTPRDGTQLTKMVRQAKVWQAFNALEDMRIETFMTTRYSNVGDWLTATVAEHLLAHPDEIKLQFPLIYGRKYLPSDIRIMVRDAYQRPQDIAELQQLIDNYIVLNLADPANYKDAFAIILRYNELVQQLMNDMGQPGLDGISDPNGHNKRAVGEWKPNNGKSLNKEQQSNIAKRIKISNGSDYDAPSKPNDGEPGNDPSTGVSAGTGTVAHNMDVLKGVLNKILDTRQEEILDTIRQFNGEATLKGKKVDEPKPYYRREDKPVHPESVAASRSFGTELDQLRRDYDPGWDRRVDAGRLNVQRYITEDKLDEVFDQWDMGREDAVDIECFVGLDISGSMNWCIDNAYESMWAIKRALDKVNASTTVVGFDDNPYMIYRSDERAGINMRFSGTAGGTNPQSTLEFANSIFAESTRAIKVLIMITDGEWYNAQETDSMIARLRNAGVVTALAYVSEPNQNQPGRTITINSHGCETAVNITDVRNLFTLARKLVKVGVARNLA